MSIKSKLSIAISLMLFFVVILYHLLSEYSMVLGIKEMMSVTMKSSSIQAAQSIKTFEEEPLKSAEDRSIKPDTMFSVLHNINPRIKEITVFDQKTLAIRYGTYTYSDANNDKSFVQALKPGQFGSRNFSMDDKKYLRSYYSDEQRAAML